MTKITWQIRGPGQNRAGIQIWHDHVFTWSGKSCPSLCPMSWSCCYGSHWCRFACFKLMERQSHRFKWWWGCSLFLLDIIRWLSINLIFVLKPIFCYCFLLYTFSLIWKVSFWVELLVCTGVCILLVYVCFLKLITRATNFLN